MPEATAREVVEVLGRYRELRDAMSELEQLGFTSRHAVARFLDRAGLESPRYYVNQPQAYAAISQPRAPSSGPFALPVAEPGADVPPRSGPVVARQSQRILVCPDAHHPYVDRRAWDCFLGAAEVLRPDVLVIIGDFADCYAISSHPKHPSRRISFPEEMEATQKALAELQRLAIPRVVFCEGNHEQRLERYITANCPELFGTVAGMRDMLQIDKRRGWEWHPYKTFVRIGQMAFTHEVGRCGVNALRQTLIDFGDNIAFGHTHRLGTMYAGTVDGKTHVGLNVGWLGDVSAVDYRFQFMCHREWQHGFGLIDQDADGVSWCQAVPIINGVCSVDGRRVAA
jgi:predicted phosphodiesterase